MPLLLMLCSFQSSDVHVSMSMPLCVLCMCPGVVQCSSVTPQLLITHRSEACLRLSQLAGGMAQHVLLLSSGMHFAGSGRSSKCPCLTTLPAGRS